MKAGLPVSMVSRAAIGVAIGSRIAGALMSASADCAAKKSNTPYKKD